MGMRFAVFYLLLGGALWQMFHGMEAACALLCLGAFLVARSTEVKS